MATVSFLTHNWNISIQNLKSAESICNAFGVSEILQLFSNGGKIKLKDIPCAQTLELMQRYANLKNHERFQRILPREAAAQRLLRLKQEEENEKTKHNLRGEAEYQLDKNDPGLLEKHEIIDGIPVQIEFDLTGPRPKEKVSSRIRRQVVRQDRLQDRQQAEGQQDPNPPQLSDEEVGPELQKYEPPKRNRSPELDRMPPLLGDIDIDQGDVQKPNENQKTPGAITRQCEEISAVLDQFNDNYLHFDVDPTGEPDYQPPAITEDTMQEMAMDADRAIRMEIGEETNDRMEDEDQYMDEALDDQEMAGRGTKRGNQGDDNPAAQKYTRTEDEEQNQVEDQPMTNADDEVDEFEGLSHEQIQAQIFNAEVSDDEDSDDHVRVRRVQKQKNKKTSKFLSKPTQYENFQNHIETWSPEDDSAKIQEEIEEVVKNYDKYPEHREQARMNHLLLVSEELKNQYEYKMGRGWIRDTAKIIELEQIGARTEIPESETWNKYGDAARLKEVNDYHSYGAVELVPWAKVPKDAHLLTARFVYTMKSSPVDGVKNMTPSHIDEFRRLDARLCVQGYPEEMKEDTQSPTAQIETTRAICAIIPIRGWNFGVIDVSRAYLQSHDLEREVWVIPPSGTDDPEKVCWKAKKPLYGLSDSTKNWAKTLIDFAVKTGAVQSVSDPSLFLWTAFGPEKWDRVEPSGKVSDLAVDMSVPPETVDDIQSREVWGLCTVYVDDVFFTGCDKFIHWFEHELTTRFKCKEASWNDAKYLGMEIKLTKDGTVELTSGGYEKCIKAIDLEPAREKQEEEFLTEDEERQFRNLLGKAMWSARIARADLTYEVAAIAQAYNHGRKLTQEYQEKSIEFEKAEEPSEIKEIAHVFEKTTGNSHMPGFDDFECVNKINMWKPRRPANKGVNFKTHLRVKNLNYLNKTVNKIKIRDNDVNRFTIKFHDVTKGKGVEDVRIVVMTDGALMNAEEKKSQVGIVAAILSKTEQYSDPDFEEILPSQVTKKKPETPYPFIGATPIMWKSQRSPRVATSSKAAEVFGLFLGVDAAVTLRKLVCEILYGTPLKPFTVDIRNDNVDVVRSVHQMGNASTEKRVQSLINSMRLLITEEDVASVRWIPGDINIADELTKPTDGNKLFKLLCKNKIQVPTKEAIFRKYQRTHTSKQHLIHTQKFDEMKDRDPDLFG